MNGRHSNATDGTWRRIQQLSVVLGLASLLAACALNETKPEPEPPPPEPQPVGPCSTLPAKDLERKAQELLDAGEWAAAREQLACALELSPGSKKAALLIEQLDADPVATLGKPHFSYTVKSNETLSKIAQQYLGSALKFVILARYNDIAVPANLPAGTVIKIPGKKPPAPAAPKPATKETPAAAPVTAEPAAAEPPAPQPEAAEPATTGPADQSDAAALRAQATAMEQKGNLEEAYRLMSQAVKADPSLANGQEDLARIKKALIAKLEGDAYDRELYGEPEKAADIWRKVLQIDPGNIPAQLALKRLTE